MIDAGHDNADLRRADVRRLVVVAALLAGLSFAWHQLRPVFIHLCATSSVGHYARDELIRAGLELAGHDVRTSRLRMHSVPAPGWVAWSRQVEVAGSPKTVGPAIWTTSFVDARFRPRGRLPTGSTSGPPMDIDGDGAWEVIVSAGPGRTDVPFGLLYYAVARMRPTGSELIWLGLLDPSPSHAQGIRVQPGWRDIDADGTSELSFITVDEALGPAGELVFKPPQVVAAFTPDAGSGLLRLLVNRADSGVTAWTPPGEAPLALDPREPLDGLFQRLLPLPAPEPQQQP